MKEPCNLAQDFNKKISKIEYNSLNLPSKLQFSEGHMAEYTYDGAGRKLSVAYTTSKTNLLVPMGSIVPPQSTNVAMTLKIDYCGNMIYENGHLSRILTDVGYITLNDTTPMYHYYLKDHLGNNRVLMNERGAVEQVNHYYTFGGLMGESMGGEEQPYKYNGNELDRMHGLDWYDYGARHYDTALGRWTTMDPLAEKYYDISPYAYCGNNPVNYFDPDGKKKHNWLSDAPKKGHILDARHNNASFQKRFTNDLVQILGEGVRDNPYQRSVSIDARIYPVYPTSGGAVGRQEVYPVDVNIKTASQLVKLLNKYDSNWRQSHGGKPIFIFHACATSDLAKEFSKSEELKDVIIIAPNAKLDTRLNGDEKVQDIATGENFKTKQEGRWEVYKNGETVRDSKGNPITYKNTDQPGTEGFNYRF